MHRAASVLFPGLIMAAAACAHGGLARGAQRLAPANPAPLLNVTNHSGSQVKVYAGYQLGTVFRFSGNRFVLRPAMIGNLPVRIYVRASSSQWFLSDPLVIAPGDTVDLEIPAAGMALSTASVRP